MPSALRIAAAKHHSGLAITGFYPISLTNSSSSQTLRVTPAMEAGLTDHVWELEELVALLD